MSTDDIFEFEDADLSEEEVMAERRLAFSLVHEGMLVYCPLSGFFETDRVEDIRDLYAVLGRLGCPGCSQFTRCMLVKEKE
jgi:hypothetical protein